MVLLVVVAVLLGIVVFAYTFFVLRSLQRVSTLAAAPPSLHAEEQLDELRRNEQKVEALTTTINAQVASWRADQQRRLRVLETERDVLAREEEKRS